MAKRVRSDSMSLTGGTKDVNPQLFKTVGIPLTVLAAASSSAITSNGITFPLPIGSFQQTASGRAVVMEVLRGQLNGFFGHTISTTGATIIRIRRGLYTGAIPAANYTSVLDAGMSHPQAVAWDEKFYSVRRNDPFSENDVHVVDFDMTDGAGHGLLVASSQMTYVCDCYVDNVATVQTGIHNSNFNAVMLYRFKEVPLAEYIGIQQSQQVNG